MIWKIVALGLFLCFELEIGALTPEALRDKIISRYGRPSAFEFVELSGGPAAMHFLFEKFNNAPQSISFLLYPTKDARWKLQLSGFARKPLATVAAQCAAKNALIGVNGGFFYIADDGAPRGILRIDGISLERDAMSDGRLLLLDGAGRFAGIVPPEKDDPKRYPNALQCTPALVAEGRALPQHDPSRHPRTAAGIRKDGTLILLVADGRHPGKAAGLTFAELGEIFAFLECEDAMNLDGGGSSTLYFRGCNPQNILNYPCDNRKFDHQGCRRVSSALLVVKATPTK